MAKSLRSERAVVKFEKAAALMARIPTRALNWGSFGLDMAEISAVLGDPEASRLEKTLATSAASFSYLGAMSEPKQRLLWSVAASLAALYPIVSHEDPSRDARKLLETETEPER